MSSGVESFQAFADGGGAVSSTSLALTAAPFGFDLDTEVNRANRARITNTSAAVILAYRYTGSAATASHHQIPVLSTIEIIGNENIKNFRIIRVGAVDGAAWVTLEE